MDIIVIISVLLLQVLGPASPFTLLCLAMHFSFLSKASKLSGSHNNHSSYIQAIHWALAGRMYYYNTGHHNDFNRLHYSAAFVGFSEFDFTIGGALLFLNTFGTEILTPMILALDLRGGGEGGMGRGLCMYVACSTLRTVLTCACVVIQRRHLMVWAIFAPKFVFDACLQIVLVAATWLAFALVSADGEGEETEALKTT